jgi:hypothetical protein
MRENSLNVITAITPIAIFRDIRAARDRTETYLKLKRVSDCIRLKNQIPRRKLIHSPDQHREIGLYGRQREIHRQALELYDFDQSSLCYELDPQSGHLGWQDELRQSLDISPFLAECRTVIRGTESKRQQKTRKEDLNPKEKESEARKELRARSSRDRNREDDSHFPKEQDAAPNSTRAKQIHPQAQTKMPSNSSQMFAMVEYSCLLW